MKYKFFVIYLLLLVSIASSHVQIGYKHMHIGYLDIEPHCYANSKTLKAQGSLINYFNDIAEKMGYVIDWVGPLPFPRLMISMRLGLIDGAVMLTRTKEREQYFYFPKKPFYNHEYSLALRKTEKLSKITKWQDIRHLTIGTLQGAVFCPFMAPIIDSLNVEYIGNNTWIYQNLEKLIKGRIDAVYNHGSASLLYLSYKLHIRDKIKIISLPEAMGKMYISFSQKSPYAKILVQNYNKCLDTLNINYDNYIKEELDKIKRGYKEAP